MKNQFRTEIKLKKGVFPEISYKSRIMLLGSCFSNSIGQKFEGFKFNNYSNPFGVTYNPISINNQLDRIINKRFFQESDLMEKDDLFNSYELHGSFDNQDKDDLLDDVNKIIERSYNYLNQASHLYITLGTAWVYELNDKNQIVNNCHKKASALFTKKLLGVDAVFKACSELTDKCKNFNPDLKIIFTLSPVRHLKDGFEENSISKSTLRLAISMLQKEKQVYYFPSYEIMNDDLRDYRFYDEDLLHPSSFAINYIWELIVNAHITEGNIELMKEVYKVKQAVDHRPFNQNSKSNKEFIKSSIEKIETLVQKHKEIDLQTELSILKDRLSK